VKHAHPLALALVLTAFPAAAQDPVIRTGAACAPVPTKTPSGARRIIGTTDPLPKALYGTGDQLVIDGGTSDGLQIGQRYFVRHQMDSFDAQRAQDTMGWLRIVATTEDTSIALVEFACAGIQTRDHLEPYADPVLPAGVGRTNSTGTLDFSKTARVLYGESNRSMVGGKDFMIAGLGEKQGATPGSRYAIYRDLKVKDIPPFQFGEAIVVSNFGDKSIIRVTSAHDAVYAGDTLVARIGGVDDSAAAGALPGTGTNRGGNAQQGAGAGGEGNAPRTGGANAAGDNVRSYTFEDIFFDFDRFNLRPEGLALLDQAVKAMTDSPTLRILIEGHTCNIGTAEYNLALGERRAGAVRDYLVNRGVSAERLSVISYGEERPKYDNAKEETRRLNRRAVLTVNLQR